MMSFRRIAEFFGLKRSIIALLGMVILVGMGERMGERFLPIYLMALGGGELTIGLLGWLQNQVGAIYSFGGGYLSDRLGFKRALLAFNLLAMMGYVLVILIPSVWAVIAGAFFFLTWSAISLPATMSLVARALPRTKRTMGVTMHSLIRRIPMALGPLIGGLFIDTWGERTGVRLAFLVALAMAIVAAAMQQVMIRDEGLTVPASTRTAEGNPLRLFRLMSPALRNLLTADTLIRFCEQIPYAFVVVWCMKIISSPVNAFRFGVLTTVEMATAVLVYVPVAYFADKTQKKPFVVITFLNFTLFPLVLIFCHSFWPLILAFILRGLKEFGEPTRKALIMDLAPVDREAGMFGLYYLIRDTVVSLAAFGGAALWMISPTANLLTAFGFGVVGTAWFAWRGKDVAAES